MQIIEKTVFISYRRANYWNALAIYQHLTAQGFDVFIDYRNIKGGAFERVITENIQYRAHFLIVLTPSALERCDQPNDWLRKEIELAIDEERNIIPLIFEGFDFGSPSVQEKLVGKLAHLSQYNGLQIYAAYFEEGMKRLAEEFLAVPLDAVLKPLSEEMQVITDERQKAAREAPKVTREELTAQEWFERGYKATDAQEQIRYYTEAIRLDPEFEYAFNNRGLSYDDLGQHERAIADYDKAIQIDPELALAYNNRGSSYADLGQHERAITDHDKAIEINPEYANAYTNRGARYGDLGQHERAIQDYDKAIEINKKLAKDYCGLGNAITSTAGVVLAVIRFKKAVAYNSEDDPDFSAEVKSALDTLETANQTLDEANEINSEIAKIYHFRGMSYASLGQHERAYEKVIQINLELSEAYSKVGICYAALGQHERAIQDYDKAIEINPEHAKAYYNKACCYGLQGKADEAVVWLREALNRAQDEYCELAKEDSDFDLVREEEKFKALMEEFGCKGDELK
ncbi:tetratricopeptide repeat protein [Chloroflexota bacterium]